MLKSQNKNMWAGKRANQRSAFYCPLATSDLLALAMTPQAKGYPQGSEKITGRQV